MSARRFVITGLGVMTSLGLDAASTWQGLVEGRSGIGPIRSFDPSGLPVRIGGELQGFDPKAIVEKRARKELNKMARTLQLAVACTQVALDHGKVDRDKLDPTRFGVEYGSGLISIDLVDLIDASVAGTRPDLPHQVDLKAWGEKSVELVQPMFMLKYLPNFLACHVSMLFNAQGPNNSVTETDAASLLALGEAYRVLQRDGADFFLVGGAESKFVNGLSLVRQCLYEQFSTWNDRPQQAHRPFDLQRTGHVLGEGAAVVVFEALDHATARGATIYAEVVGFGAAFDLKRDGKGLARAIRAAMAEAGVGPGDLDHVNAHGAATTAGDVMEAAALREVFGEAMPPVVAYKSSFGQLGAAGGLAELSASVLALRDGVLPGTLNHDTPDPACPVRVHTGAPRPVEKPFVLKTGYTALGQCGAVVVRKWGE